MKKKSFLLLVLALFAVSVTFAQDINKLHKNLYTAKSDTARVTALIRLGEWHLKHYGQTDFPTSADSTWYYAKKSEALSITKKAPVSLGKSYCFYSLAYITLINTDKSSIYAQKAIKVLEKTQDKEALCNAYNALLTSELQRVPLNNNALDIAQKTLKLSRSIKNLYLEARTLEKIGYYYTRIVNYVKATEYLEQSIIIYKKIGERERLKSICSNIAVFYKITGEVDKALKYNMKTVALLKQDKEHDIEDSYVYGTIGDTYSELGDLKASITYCTKAWEIAKKFNNRNYEAFSEVSLIDRFSENNQPDKAKFHYNNLESYLNELDPLVKAHATATLLEHSFSLGYMNKAKKYANISIQYLENKNSIPEINRSINSGLMEYFFYVKDYDKSKKYAQAYATMARQAHSLPRLEQAYKQFFKIDSAQGNYLSAIKNHKISTLYKDSILTEGKTKEIARLETVFKTQEKENDNKLLKQNAELQATKLSKANLEKNLSLFGVLLLIIVIGLFYRRYNINQKIKNQTNLKNKMLETLLTEKEWLLKEIHHRVKNNLQIVMSLLSIQSHFLDDEIAKAAIKNSHDRIHSMSLIHKKLYQSDNIVSIDMGLYIKELVEYFKATFDTSQRIRFIIEVDPIELTSSQAVPLGLIINETIINSLKHAFPKDRKGSIEITLKETADNKIALVVKDNGIGSKNQESISESESLGIKLIKGFSKELNAKLQFINDEGLSVSLTFNKNSFNSNKASA